MKFSHIVWYNIKKTSVLSIESMGKKYYCKQKKRQISDKRLFRRMSFTL